MRRYDCGCEFHEGENGLIFDPEITSIPLNCSATWDLICEGNTKGVFQLESQLGRSLAKQTKPRNMEELSDLIAIMRPGCLEAMVKGKSLTMHYIDRKHFREPEREPEPLTTWDKISLDVVEAELGNFLILFSKTFNA